MKIIAAILVCALHCQAQQQPPSSAGKPPYPPPIVVLPPPPAQPPVYYPPYYVYTNAPHVQQYAVGADFVPNGEWKAVCKNWDCGATNKITPAKTNTVVIDSGTGGRTVEKWIMMKCPVCTIGFSNRFESVWMPDVPPLPVLVPTNLTGISTNKPPR